MARKMKDSGIEWIGEIPEGWGMCLYKYCCSVQPGYPFDSAKFSNFSTDGFPIIRIRDITSGEIHTYYTGEYSPNYIVTAGDLLVGMDGDFNVRWWNNDAALLNQRCCRVTEKDSVLRRFLYYVLPFTLQHINTLTYATTVKHLANGDILNSFIAFPSLPTQQNIVHYLDTVCSKIDSMLSKTRSSIEEYKKLKQAVITQAVTKGVHGEREMKDSGVDYIGQIPAKWVLGKLRNVGDTQNGISKSSEFFGKGFPFVSYSDVYKNYSLPFAVSGLVESTPEEQERYSVKEGDIFFTRTSETIEEVGFSCVCEKDIPNATFAGFLIRVRPFSDRLYTPYAKYYFRSTHLRFYLVKEMNLVTRASLGQSLLKSMPVLLPPLEEQKEIADYLDAKCAEIDGLIAKKEQLVKELESYKKSLIYEVVTGKREV